MNKLEKLEKTLFDVEVIKNYFPDVRVFHLLKEVLNSAIAEKKMQPMATAPKDRGILLRTKYDDESGSEPYEKYSVAKYAEWTGRGYEQVWETGPGECIRFDSDGLLGWYELPGGDT